MSPYSWFAAERIEEVVGAVVWPDPWPARAS